MNFAARHRTHLLWLFPIWLLVTSLPARAADRRWQPEFIARIDRAIGKIRTRELNSVTDSPWVVMHAVIAFEKDLNVVDVGAKRKRNAIEYLCESARFDGQRIFRVADGLPALPTRGLSFGMRESFKIQDHVDQFLMAFADADVPLDQPIVADGGKRFTVADMLSAARKNFSEDQELGWTLVAVSHYLPIDQRWTAGSGKKYGINDLVALAIAQDPRRQTEGGPHHLYGIAYAIYQYQQSHDGKLDGEWAAARKYLDQYVALARKYQLDDGSFSVGMFRGSRAADSPRQMVWATGHTIEWLAVALSAEQLRQAWIRRGVHKLLEVIENEPLAAFSDGGIYHAAHALRLYKNKIATARQGP